LKSGDLSFTKTGFQSYTIFLSTCGCTIFSSSVWKSENVLPISKESFIHFSLLPKNEAMNQNQRVQIDKPCQANWNNMLPAEKGKFCQQCSKVVIDFSGKTLEEINLYLSTASKGGICGRYQERHTTANSKWYTLLNSIEARLSKMKLQRLSMLLITGLMILTGCHHRRVQGAYSSFSSKKNKDKETLREQLSQHPVTSFRPGSEGQQL
jgi:hypothetical protein